MAAGRPVSGNLAQGLRCYRSGDTDRVPGRWDQASGGIRVPAESGGMTRPLACRVPDNTERYGQRPTSFLAW